ncbi:hypothetical protein H634G_11600 [Metarhizium anisopliae BRIP 53293]|uniref:Uncharacterized protein n=1 Tax=Metarhizium anisopliae BRIP 53293 TaxID=1291518 RepID=A0A0D9NH86_METAN|nr:hypothetical protein H634G_11600 [Metarhizium anisopliae BRIP 53293]
MAKPFVSGGKEVLKHWPGRSSSGGQRLRKSRFRDRPGSGLHSRVLDAYILPSRAHQLARSLQYCCVRVSSGCLSVSLCKGLEGEEDPLR